MMHPSAPFPWKRDTDTPPNSGDISGGRWRAGPPAASRRSPPLPPSRHPPPLPPPRHSSSSRSRSPPQRRCSSSAARRGRPPSSSSPPQRRGGRSPSSPPPKKPSSPPPPRKASPVPDESSLVLHVDRLSWNVNEAHLKWIFENYGEVVNVELCMDRVVNLPRGYGYVEFKRGADAEKALLYMDGGQIDENVVKVRFTPATAQTAVASSPKALPHLQKEMCLKMTKLVILLKRPRNSGLENKEKGQREDSFFVAFWSSCYKTYCCSKTNIFLLCKEREGYREVTVLEAF